MVSQIAHKGKDLELGHTAVAKSGRSQKEQIDGGSWVGIVVSASIWHIVHAAPEQQPENQVVGDGHCAGALSGETTAVLAQSLVSPIVQSVLDTPVSAHNAKESVRTGLRGRQTGHAIARLFL